MWRRPYWTPTFEASRSTLPTKNSRRRRNSSHFVMFTFLVLPTFVGNSKFMQSNKASKTHLLGQKPQKRGVLRGLCRLYICVYIYIYIYIYTRHLSRNNHGTHIGLVIACPAVFMTKTPPGAGDEMLLVLCSDILMLHTFKSVSVSKKVYTELIRNDFGSVSVSFGAANLAWHENLHRRIISSDTIRKCKCKCKLGTEIQKTTKYMYFLFQNVLRKSWAGCEGQRPSPTTVTICIDRNAEPNSQIFASKNAPNKKETEGGKQGKHWVTEGGI